MACFELMRCWEPTLSLSLRSHCRSTVKLSWRLLTIFRKLANKQTSARDWKQNRRLSPAKCNKKLSCRRETAQCSKSLNINLAKPLRPLKVIRSDTFKYDVCNANDNILEIGTENRRRKPVPVFWYVCHWHKSLLFHSDYDLMLYHFWEKAMYWSKMAISHTPLHLTPPFRYLRWNIAIKFGMERL